MIMKLSGQVIRGEWGVGQERIKQLTEAGHNALRKSNLHYKDHKLMIQNDEMLLPMKLFRATVMEKNAKSLKLRDHDAVQQRVNEIWE